MSSSGPGGPPEGGGNPNPDLVKRSASIRRLSTEAAELALHLDGIDLADLEEVDAAAEAGQEEEEAVAAEAGAGSEGLTTHDEAAPRSNTSDISAELADLNERWASSASGGAAGAPASGGRAPRRPSEKKNRHQKQQDENSLERAPSRRTSTHTYSSDANRSAGSLFSTGSHGSFGASFGSTEKAIIGALKGVTDEDDNKESTSGEGDAGAGVRPTGAPLPRRASTKSIGSIDLGVTDYDEEPIDDGVSQADRSAAAGEVVMPSRGFRASSMEAPSSPSRRQTPPARYDPEAIGKILGPDDEADAEEAAWSELGKYERSIGYKPGRNRRASDYAQGNDADSAFEKEWGDMVAVSAAGCGRGLRANGHAIRVACGVLAFCAAAVAVGIGTFAGVERLVVSSSSSGSGSSPTPVAEVSEEDRIQGALPTPTPPELPSDLADACSVEAFSADPSSERRCKEACTAAECCFVDDEFNAAMSCKEKHPDTCQEYETYCAALDLELE